MSKRRLGKGLNALISNSNKQQMASDSGVKNISMDLIKLNPYQPRQEFDDKSLDELSQSIQEHGLIQPILVREENDKYQIVAGERRYKAAMKAGFNKIKAIVSNFNDQEMMEIALIENLQRQDLNSIEEAQAYQKLINKFDLSQVEVAKRVGKSRSSISNSLRLLKLSPEVKEYI